MIGFRDTTYCCSPACKNECGRQFTEEDHKAALKWWGGPNYPIAVAHFCDEKGNYIKNL